MFASIAPRYDLCNRLLSMGQDRRWRAAMCAELPALRPGDRLLDLCTGTGDVALELARGAGPGVAIHGGDFCEAMVALAPDKARRQPGPRPSFHVSDAQALPFAADTFRAVSVAFGLRNVEQPACGLAEMARVLQPGGRLLILEFGRPQNRAFAALYRFYFFQILPRVGRMLSRSDVDAYGYLPESVWAFFGPDELAARMRSLGLQPRPPRSFLGGAVLLFVAEKRAT
jgi:demethylmenaquinone methyltransferase/2-methoxy-6-polyprenyl-1,4-benzoquinol methylase